MASWSWQSPPSRGWPLTRCSRGYWLLHPEDGTNMENLCLAACFFWIHWHSMKFFGRFSWYLGCFMSAFIFCNSSPVWFKASVKTCQKCHGKTPQLNRCLVLIALQRCPPSLRELLVTCNVMPQPRSGYSTVFLWESLLFWRGRCVRMEKFIRFLANLIASIERLVFFVIFVLLIAGTPFSILKAQIQVSPVGAWINWSSNTHLFKTKFFQTAPSEKNKRITTQP